MERISVGIDVAKNRLDVHVRPSGEAFAVARDGKGLEDLADRLGGLDASLVLRTRGGAVCGGPAAGGGHSRLVRRARPHLQGRVMERISVGIDVAKNRLDVHVRPSGEAELPELGSLDSRKMPSRATAKAWKIWRTGWEAVPE